MQALLSRELCHVELALRSAGFGCCGEGLCCCCKNSVALLGEVLAHHPHIAKEQRGPARSDEASPGSAPSVPAGRSLSAAGAAPAAAGSTPRGAERQVQVPSSGRCVRATRRARTAGRQRRRRTTRAQAASEDGSADATRPPSKLEFVHPTGRKRPQARSAAATASAASSTSTTEPPHEPRHE